MSQTKFRGVAVPLDGRLYVVPSLSVRDFREHAKVLLVPTQAQNEEEFLADMEARIHVIGLAIRRNYPHVTDEHLADWLDLDTLPLAFLAVQNAAGLEKVQDDQQGNE